MLKFSHLPDASFQKSLDAIVAAVVSVEDVLEINATTAT